MEQTMSEETKLHSIKDQLDSLGVTYHPNTGIEKLKTLLAKATVNEKEETVSTKETKSETKLTPMQEATRLIRVIVTPVDPLKKLSQGEIFTVSNDVIGTIRKYIAFNTEDGYHVPNIILDMLKEKKYTAIIQTKGSGGTKTTTRELPAFNIVELEPLTQKELDALAAKQSSAGLVGKDN